MINRLIDFSVSHQLAVPTAIALACAAGIFRSFVLGLVVYPAVYEGWNSGSGAHESEAA